MTLPGAFDLRPWPPTLPLEDYGVQSRNDVLVEPTDEPLTLEDAKTHLRVTNTSEDAYVSDLIVVARDEGEEYTRRSWMPQTRALMMDRFPCGGLVGAVIRVGRPPVREIVSIEYIDPAGVTQTLDPATYQVDLPRGSKASYARLRPVPDTWWPDTQCGRLDAVTITYLAGYAVDVTSPQTSPPTPDVITVPKKLLHGMKLMIGELYKTRAESVNAVQAEALIRARALWHGYRVY